jgi:hypothetical protein
MKSQTMGLKVASVLFMAMALVHASRLVFAWSVRIGGWQVGLWPSIMAALIGATLSVWMGSLACRGSRNADPTQQS